MSRRAKLRACAGLTSFLLLAGCSRSFPVEASFENGRIRFDAKEKLNGCLYRFHIGAPDGETMWSVWGYFRSNPCDDLFPIFYGVVPKGLSERTTAKPLKEGITYRIEASDGDRYYGAFSYRRTVVIENRPEIARKP